MNYKRATTNHIFAESNLWYVFKSPMYINVGHYQGPKNIFPYYYTMKGKE